MTMSFVIHSLLLLGFCDIQHAEAYIWVGHISSVPASHGGPLRTRTLSLGFQFHLPRAAFRTLLAGVLPKSHWKNSKNPQGSTYIAIIILSKIRINHRLRAHGLFEGLKVRQSKIAIISRENDFLNSCPLVCKVVLHFCLYLNDFCML